MPNKEPIPYGPQLLSLVPRVFKGAAIKFIAARTDSCFQITRRMSDSLERPPGVREKFSVWWHSMICRACARYLQQIKVIRDAAAAGAADDPTLNGALSDEARSRISESLEDAVDP